MTKPEWLAASIMDHWPFQRIDGETIRAISEYRNGFDLELENGQILEVRVSARQRHPRKRRQQPTDKAELSRVGNPAGPGLNRVTDDRKATR